MEFSACRPALIGEYFYWGITRKFPLGSGRRFFCPPDSRENWLLDIVGSSHFAFASAACQLVQNPCAYHCRLDSPTIASAG